MESLIVIFAIFFIVGAVGFWRIMRWLILACLALLIIGAIAQALS